LSFRASAQSPIYSFDYYFPYLSYNEAKVLVVTPAHHKSKYLYISGDDLKKNWQQYIESASEGAEGVSIVIALSFTNNQSPDHLVLNLT
jgi:hypothetical protein